LQEAQSVAEESINALQQCCDAARLLSMHAIAMQRGWHALAAKAATSLLRFIVPVATSAGKQMSVVPVDKALYLAGTVWQQVRLCHSYFTIATWICRTDTSKHCLCSTHSLKHTLDCLHSMPSALHSSLRAQVPDAQAHAFALLNAYVDAAEAIVDGSAAALDLSAFDAMFAPPVDTPPLPVATGAYVDESEAEAVKEWVIEAAMSGGVASGGAAGLPQRTCAHDRSACVMRDRQDT
jgi:hypothetical protein